MSAHETIARNIQALRGERGWSVRQLAEECAKRGATTLTQASLTNIERGLNSGPSRSQRRVTVDELVFLADLFGVTPTDLFAQRAVCDQCNGTGYTRVAAETAPDVSPSHADLTTPAADASEVASSASRARWAPLTADERTAATAAARASFDQRWETLVDPDATLSAEERVQRAAEAKRAHYADMALKGAEVRRAKAEARKAVTR